MSVDIESFQNVLKHPIRRKVILALNQSESLSYTDLMGVAESSNTGKFNYHLKILADLIKKDNDGKYKLTEKGRLAAEFLQTFQTKKQEPTPLRMADALLIGFVGFALTLANPGFWGFMQAAAMNVKSIPVLSAFNWLGFGFALIVPGFLMWLLATRRAHSHDAYDLYKAPLIACVMLLTLVVVMVVFHVNVGAQVQIQVGPTVGGENWTKTTYTILMTSLANTVAQGAIFAFVGTAIAELGSRIKKKRKG